ncbi:DUF6113 family protein [Frondihabitans cladoniiphilus]|uniref:N-acetyl-1-D-myo-inositol-2-amino-2-deoxy-alpha-D-glucopyranoside deacetylase n=1 Tax=Frondihabitans cladoniiphilus TaxID=715785 RepID=A0ABP8VUY7_9MICO
MSSPDALAPSRADGVPLDRVLLVHAHPDDETITTGATLAALVDAGARVTVVTCTRGELGEVMPDDLAALRTDPAALAVHREGEIARAMQVLGVRDHRFLGAPGARTAGLAPRPYRDSGMQWSAEGVPVPVADLDPASFCAAEFSEIVSDLAAVVADLEPTAIVSYDTDGGYGHPDHVRVNRAALQVARLTGVPFFAITGGTAHPEAGALGPVASADVVIDGSRLIDRKVDALREYRTQVAVVTTAGGPALEFPHGAVEPVSVVETFRHQAEPLPPVTSSAPDMAELGRSGRAVTLILALVVGALFGAIGSVSYQIDAGSFPIGIVLSLVVVAVLLLGFRVLFDSRRVAAFAAVGVLVVLVLLSFQSAGGSVLITGDALGLVWIFGAVVIALFVVGWPKLPSRGTRRPGAGDKMKASLQDSQGLPDAKEQPRP